MKVYRVDVEVRKVSDPFAIVLAEEVRAEFDGVFIKENKIGEMYYWIGQMAERWRDLMPSDMKWEADINEFGDYCYREEKSKTIAFCLSVCEQKTKYNMWEGGEL